MVSAPAKRSADEGYAIRFPPQLPLTDDLLLQFGLLNDHLRLERTAEGALVIAFPPGTESAYAENQISRQLGNWAEQRAGVSFGPSGTYVRPDGRALAPDASWITQQQWDALSADERRVFMRTCPVFVVEVRSPGQTLASQQRRMDDWIAFGVQLGWLVDLQGSRLWVYRPGREPEALRRPASISGDPELPGLVVNLANVWR